MNYPFLKGQPHCARCGETDKSELLIHGTKPLHHWCRRCNSRYVRDMRRKHGSKAQIAANLRYVKRNPKRLKAWAAVNQAGLRKAKPCAKCGDKNTHAHHPKPEKKLLIVFLCPLHHKRVHQGKMKCPRATDYSKKPV